MAWSDVEGISDDESVVEISASEFRGNESAFEWEKEAVVIDSSDDDVDNETVGSSSYNAGKSSELGTASEGDADEEVKPEEDLALENVDVEGDEEVEPEESEEFDLPCKLILGELDIVAEQPAVTSKFKDVTGRVKRSFDNVKEMYRYLNDDNAPMGAHRTHSVASSCRKEEDMLLRLLIKIKNQHSRLLNTGQLHELDTMVQCLASFRNSGSSTPDFPSRDLIPSASRYADLPKQKELGVTRSRKEFIPMPDRHGIHDGENVTCENSILPIKERDGPGAAMIVGGMDSKSMKGAFLRYASDASKASTMQQQACNETDFIANSWIICPGYLGKTKGNNDTRGHVSSPLFDSRPANITNSSELLGSSSSRLCITSSNGLQGAVVRGTTPAGISVESNRNPSFKILNSEIEGTHNHNSRKLPEDSSSYNALLGLSMKLGKPDAVDEPFLGAHTLKRQRIGLQDPRLMRGVLLEESCVPTSQSSNIDERKHKDVDEPLLGVQTLKRQRHHLSDSSDVLVKTGVGEQTEENRRFLTCQPSNVDATGQTKRPGNGVASKKMLNVNSNLNVGIGQNSLVGAVPAVSLPSLMKDIDVNPTIRTKLIDTEQKRLAAKNRQNTEEITRNSRIIPNANVLPRKKSESGAFFKTTTREQKSAVKPHLPGQRVSLSTQTGVGRLQQTPRDPRRICHQNIVQSSQCLQPESSKASGNHSSKDRGTAIEQGKQIHTTSSSHPDNSHLVTSKVKNNSSTKSTLQTPVPLSVGISRTSDSWGDVGHLLDGYDDQHKAAILRERSRRIEEQNKMFAARKLCLVLDLDHTLLNSAKFSDMEPILDEKLRKMEEKDRAKPQRHIFRFQQMGLWTKLRPGVWNFLKRASKLFELHIYTMGNKLYATEMAKVLDPTGSLFAGRVISRGDDNHSVDGFQMMPKTKDLDGVLGMESAVLIIDDCLKVWPHNKHNLIVVERYTFFPCSRRQFGLPGPSLLERDIDERVRDGTLASTLSVIERVRSKFFSHHNLNDVDVRIILSSEQRKILRGCRILFSGIFPIEETNPHLHPLWQTAEQFGAVCTTQIDEKVTHVVANLRGTDKVKWALSTRRYVVKPNWLEASALLYRRAQERDFTVKQLTRDQD